MPDTTSQLLSYPFEKEQLIWPKEADNVLILNAQYETEARAFEKADWVQPFNPYYDVLKNKKFSVSASIVDDKKYNYAFCVLSKQKEAAKYQISKCLNALDDKGLLLVTAMNDAGGKRIEKWFKEFGLQPQALSKSKCRIVWAYKSGINQNQIDSAISVGQKQIQDINGIKYTTQAGIYGWNKIDQGSKLLVENIENNLSGTGADFGCGYGYLSDQILKNNKVKKLYAIDADYNALECAKENLKNYEDKTTIDYQWADLRKPILNSEPLNWIIMNPPFHEGKAVNSDIGQDFIETAFKSLARNGILYMVANAHLPYEKALSGIFSSVEKVVEENGFKVFRAVK